MTPDQSQQISLVTAILGGNLSIAAILFGVLGFIYAIYASFASPPTPKTPINQMDVPILPSPVLAPLALIARFVLCGLVISVIVAVGCFIWFLYPEKWLLVLISIGLLIEFLSLLGVGFFIVFKLLPSS